MQSPEASIHCPNPTCQTLNPESHRFCQQCRTTIPKQYLWAVGKDAGGFQPGDTLLDRYLCKHSRVFLDTKPGFLPESPDDLTDTLESYMRLIAYQPQVPQVYAVMPASQRQAMDLLLLEQVPVYAYTVEAGGTLIAQEGELMPELDAVWPQASALRQLNWLWQMAQLLGPLAKQRVSQSLLQSVLLRTEGGMVRLLELARDREAEATLADLGHFWKRWVAGAHPAIAAFLQELCQQLEGGYIQTTEHLCEILDAAILHCGQAQNRELRTATLTDKGPVRQRNEDACFPPSGSTATTPLEPFRASTFTNANLPIVVVCDGIGGHEGGNIASNLAIATIQQHLQSNSASSETLTPESITTTLEQAALTANDVIAQRNDAEQRHERQRMGTTLVMALGYAHQLFVTHVGDSRAYRITPLSCHQVTLDDDLASREVRLGYSLYRQALRQPSSGSLVQALGMSASATLHPTVQRFVLDEDCLFLLCSDGLSDNDRVEQHWQTVLLPVLAGQVDLATAAQQLVTIANEQNGHDNVTVGLVHCRVTPRQPENAFPVPPDLAQRSPTLPKALASEKPTRPVSSTLKTQTMQPEEAKPRRSLSSLLLGLLLIGGLGGLLTYLLVTGFEQLTQTTPSPSPTPTNAPEATLASPPSLPTPKNGPSLAVGSRFLVNRADPNGNTGSPVLLFLQQPSAASTPTPPPLGVPVGSVLEIVNQERDRTGQNWLQVKVCSLAQPSPTSAPGIRDAGQPSVRAGEVGWAKADAIAPFITGNVSLTNDQLGQCGNARKPLQSP